MIYDWFLQAASRHQCAYLIHLHEQEFILQGGDQDWLKGPAYIPTKLRKLHEVNKILAHRPWLFNKSHIEVESMFHVFISLWKLKCKLYKPELFKTDAFIVRFWYFRDCVKKPGRCLSSYRPSSSWHTSMLSLPLSLAVALRTSQTIMGDSRTDLTPRRKTPTTRTIPVTAPQIAYVIYLLQFLWNKAKGRKSHDEIVVSSRNT